MTKRQMQILSHGGGRQTNAILVLIDREVLPPPDLIIMADTGRERSSTWRYLWEYSKPLIDSLGIPFVIAEHELANRDLYSQNGDLLLPVFTKTGKLPIFCSSEWKKLVVRRKLRQLGVKSAQMWVGMSLDEVHRMRTSEVKWLQNHYPLCFDVKKRTHECTLLVEEYGWPTPPESSCWCCPNMHNHQWQDIHDNDKNDWRLAVELDSYIRNKDKRGGVFLHRSAEPLAIANLTITGNEQPLWECADVCMT